MPELLPRFFRMQQQIEDLRRIGRILEETGEVPENVSARVHHASADGHRRDRARGIPIVGRVGGSGASPGTDPVSALLRKESERRR